MEREYLTVSVLNKYIKRKFDADPHLANVFVKGEISNYKRYPSGHAYFTLKDEKAVVHAVFFRQYNQAVPFEIENGMMVQLEAQCTVYETDGKYQLLVKRLLLDGVGDLFVAFEQMKKRLEAEGLFRQEDKKPIPLYPERIGIITSTAGAAIRDMVTTIRRRFPIAKILIFPAVVQGKESADSLVQAIELANTQANIDILIIGRGGGSIEDLWSFNEEKVARAIYASQIPVISAVGHETDVTIADYVADLRAPTPTGAAEMATPAILDLLDRLHLLRTRVLQISKQQLESHQQRLDYLAERFSVAMKGFVDVKRKQLEWQCNELKHLHPKERIQQQRQSILRIEERLNREILQNIQMKKQAFLKQYALLNAVDPLKIMNRGYAMISDPEGKSIKSIRSVATNDSLQIRVADGFIDTIVEKTRES